MYPYPLKVYYATTFLSLFSPLSTTPPLRKGLVTVVTMPKGKLTRGLERGRMPTKRVPVVGKDGTPLTPCTPAKARKLIEGGVAKKRWSKFGILYIQMLVDTRKDGSGKHGEDLADLIIEGEKKVGLHLHRRQR
jgi:hypothetical protein